MISSDTTKEIALALVNFHKEVGVIKKNATNPFLKNKYADLPDILEAVRDPLNNNGLVITHFPECGNMLTTKLMHTSGEWMQATFEMQLIAQNPQAQGSGITYARRYAVASILSLTIDEDDDGNAAAGKKIPVQRPPGTSNNKPIISRVQWNKALQRIDAGEKDVIKKLQESFYLTPEQVTTLNKKK